MTLGDGIFCTSLLVIGALGVWALSRAKKWRLIAKLLAVAALAVAVAFGAFASYERYENRARALDGLWGIRFGATPLEVQLLKGKADADDKPERDGDAVKLTRVYGLDSHLIHLVVFKNNKAMVICSDGGEYLFGFTGTTSEDEIVRKFGPPTHTSIRSDGLAKAISYAKYNVGFEIEKGVLKEICADSGGKLTYNNEYRPEGYCPPGATAPGCPVPSEDLPDDLKAQPCPAPPAPPTPGCVSSLDQPWKEYPPDFTPDCPAGQQHAQDTRTGAQSCYDPRDPKQLKAHLDACKIKPHDPYNGVGKIVADSRGIPCNVFDQFDGQKK